jgi:hypothetical protein
MMQHSYYDPHSAAAVRSISYAGSVGGGATPRGSPAATVSNKLERMQVERDLWQRRVSELAAHRDAVRQRALEQEALRQRRAVQAVDSDELRIARGVACTRERQRAALEVSQQAAMTREAGVAAARAARDRYEHSLEHTIHLREARATAARTGALLTRSATAGTRMDAVRLAQERAARQATAREAHALEGEMRTNAQDGSRTAQVHSLLFGRVVRSEQHARHAAVVLDRARALQTAREQQTLAAVDLWQDRTAEVEAARRLHQEARARIHAEREAQSRRKVEAAEAARAARVAAAEAQFEAARVVGAMRSMHNSRVRVL